MAIEKNNFRVSRFDSEFSTGSKESMSSEEDELQLRSSAIDSDEDEFDDADSGAGSDDFDLLELGETGAEFCQIGSQSCAVPFELYDLPGLQEILSLDVWNDCLTDEDRFNLAQYLPDMDQFSFMHTLKDLFSGSNFHFGSPISKLFDMLKGGLCEPRVSLYRQALNYFQRRKHYHLLRIHQNNIVGNLCQIRDAWHNCKGYSIEERLQVLNIVKSQKSLMHEKMEDFGMDTEGSSERSGEGFWSRRLKNKRVAQKPGRRTAYGEGPSVDFPSPGNSMALELGKYGKRNPRGLLKLAGSKASTVKELPHCLPLACRGSEIKSGSYNSTLSSWQNKAAGYDSGAAFQLGDQIISYDVPEETMYEVPVHNVSRGSAVDKSGVSKLGKKHERLRGDDFPGDSSMGFPSTLKDVFAVSGRNKNANLANDRTPYEYAKKLKYPKSFQQSVVEDQMISAKGRAPRTSVMGNRADLSDGTEPFWKGNMQGETFVADLASNYDEWNVKSKKMKHGTESSDLKLKSFRASSLQISDRFFHPDCRTISSEEKVKGKSRHSKEPDMGGYKGIKTFVENEETESGSSEPDDDCLLIRSKSGHSRNVKVGKKDRKVTAGAFDGNTHSSRRMSDFGEYVPMPKAGNYVSRAKKKGKMRESNHSQKSASMLVEDQYFSGLGKLHEDDERKRVYKSGKKNGQVQGGAGERLRMSSLHAYSAERRQRGDASHDYSVHQLNHFRDCTMDDDYDSLGKIGQLPEAYENNCNERTDSPLLGCSSETKKWKLKDDVAYGGSGDEYDDLQPNTQIEAFDPPIIEMGATDEVEIKPGKKQFTLITPTVHTGFSFSIVHLLSAVRMAMITPHLEDSFNVGNQSNKSNGMHRLRDELNRNHETINRVHHNEDVELHNSEYSEQMNVPSLSVQEVVNRVRSNPGDPCILETQEPLLDLVKGVLKIFSSKSAPLGAKGWKALVLYEKSTKSWSWIGPVSQNASDHETIEEVTSPEAWGLPHKMLVKLVDAFANWLKSSQEILQQIGSLPSPPLLLMQFNLDEKERFKDLRAQKSLTTISESSEEVRDYFRKEEFLRYSVPDRSFSYTAADGKKSVVAPLRRCGGKPTSKARDHFMLKRDRPPHVTILCLVRDAASRLPGSIGTRADVCTLIRDSQYIVEDVSDAQVNQVVSGALDRLHYERDPCVQFDGERKLWVYLHREREEEDFEDDGTSSTKKWKRPKKDAVEQFDQETVGVAIHGTGERMSGGGSATGFDLTSDLNVDPSCVDDDNKVDFLYNDARKATGENDDYGHIADQGTSHCNPLLWEALGLNTLQDGKLLCQENSTNDDFGDEEEKPAGLFGAGLF